MKRSDIEWLEYANKFHYGNHPEINTAVKHALEALEKQIPKKTHYVSQQRLITDLQGSANGWCDFSYFECPSCGLKLDWFDEDCYCYHCGQKLSGSDFEQEV